MNRILSFIILLLTGMLSGINPLYAQSDSNIKKHPTAGFKQTDSEKNETLSKQSEEFNAFRANHVRDSFRILQLKKEILQLGETNKVKQQALIAERDQLIAKDSLENFLLKQKIDSLRTKISGFPVVLDKDTLFLVYVKLGSITAKARADFFSKRILSLAKDYFFNPDSLKIVPADLSTDITYKDDVIKSVTDMDAIWEYTTREELAEKYISIISLAVKKYKSEHDWKTITKDILLAILVLAILILIIYFILKFFKWIKIEIEKLKGQRFKGVKIRNYEFLDTNRQVFLVNSVLNAVKWFIILVVVYLSLPVLLGIFPWTVGFSGKLISSFINPVKDILISIWYYLPKLVTIIVLVIIFRYLIRMVRFFKIEIEKGDLKIPGFYVDWANPTYQIIRVLVLAFMLIVIFPYLPGSDSQVFKGVSVFLGVLFTFGSAGALSNVVAGLVLTYMRAYRIGDRVKIGEATGDVIEKSLLVTKIKTIKNEIVSIPNSTVMSSHTTNFSAEASMHGLIIHTSVTIGYDAPWRKVHELLIEAALATDLIDKEPTPFVLQDSLQDFYISYQINAYTRAPTQQHIIYSHLHQNIQDKFNEAGVEIMSSHYTNIRDGNKTTIPAENLSKDYVAPSFNIKTDK